MSRKYDRTMRVNQKVLDILNDPATLHYLGGKLIRKRPKYMPWLIWRAILWIVLAPPAKERPQTDAKETD